MELERIHEALAVYQGPEQCKRGAVLALLTDLRKHCEAGALGWDQLLLAVPKAKRRRA